MLGPQRAALLLAEVSHSKRCEAAPATGSSPEDTGVRAASAPDSGRTHGSSRRSSSRTRAARHGHGPGVIGAGHPVPVYTDGVYTCMSCITHKLKPTLTHVCWCMHTYPVYTCVHPVMPVPFQSPHTRAWGHGVFSDAMTSHNSVLTLSRVRSAPKVTGSVPSPPCTQQPEPLGSPPPPLRPGPVLLTGL